MGLSLIDRNLTEDNYDEYVEKVVNIFRLSNKESSILFNININNYKAVINLSIVRQDGEKEEFTDVVLKCDEVFFKYFLPNLVKQLCRNCEVISKDVVNAVDSDLLVFRMVMFNNDLFTIEGLNNEDADYLLKQDDKKVEIINEYGAFNVKMFLLMLLLLIVSFILIVLFVS